MKRQIAVIGLGKFGYKIIETLAEHGMQVLALDKSAKVIEKVKDLVAEAVELDTLDREALEASGVKEADAVIVALGTEVESSILMTSMLHEMGIKEIIARAESRLHAKILSQVGATRIVFPEEDMAIRIAHSVLQPSIRDYIELGGEFDLAEIEVKNGNHFVGKKLLEINIEKNYEVTLLTIKKKKLITSETGSEESCEVSQLPYIDYKIEAGDVLVVVGNKKNIEELGNMF